MSLPERPKVLPMKSLYIWVLLAMIGILGLSFLAFRAISQRMKVLTIDPMYDRFDELQLESARSELAENGQKSLGSYLANLDNIFSGSHYLLDQNGLDLINGVNRAALLPPPPLTKSRTQTHDH